MNANLFTLACALGVLGCKNTQKSSVTSDASMDPSPTVHFPETCTQTFGEPKRIFALPGPGNFVQMRVSSDRVVYSYFLLQPALGTPSDDFFIESINVDGSDKKVILSSAGADFTDFIATNDDVYYSTPGDPSRLIKTSIRGSSATVEVAQIDPSFLSRWQTESVHLDHLENDLIYAHGSADTPSKTFYVFSINTHTAALSPLGSVVPELRAAWFSAGKSPRFLGKVDKSIFFAFAADLGLVTRTDSTFSGPTLAAAENVIEVNSPDVRCSDAYVFERSAYCSTSNGAILVTDLESFSSFKEVVKVPESYERDRVKVLLVTRESILFSAAGKEGTTAVFQMNIDTRIVRPIVCDRTWVANFSQSRESIFWIDNYGLFFVSGAASL